MVRRLLLVLLLAAAVEAVAFGVRRVTAEQCLHNLDFLRGEAPFFLGTAAAIHIGSTKSCIAGYYGHGDPGPAGSAYRFCIPIFEAGILPSVRNHAAISPVSMLQDPVVTKQMEQCNFTRQLRSGSLELHQAHQAQAFSPQYVAGTLISELKHMAEARLGREIEYAVLTVPRHVTYAGMVLGGFRSVKVVDEQIAAAAAHGHHLQPGDGKVVLVFHVGGRTTHATIFKFINGMPWYNSHDNLFFGGDDFTERLVHHLVELVKQQHGTDIRHDKAALLRLRAECERAKKTLSDQQETIVQVESLVDGSVDLFTAPLTRAKFEELNRDLFERAIHLLDRTVMNAPVVDDHDGAAESSRKKALIDEIVLVGGSSWADRPIRQGGAAAPATGRWNPCSLLLVMTGEPVVHPCMKRVLLAVGCCRTPRAKKGKKEKKRSTGQLDQINFLTLIC